MCWPGWINTWGLFIEAERPQTHGANPKGWQQMNTRNMLTTVLVTGLIGTASRIPAADCSWTQKTSMPTARLLPATGVVDGKIYAIGGGVGISGPYLATVEVYDPATDAWTQGRPICTPQEMDTPPLW
jgi:hypothetical protein